MTKIAKNKVLLYYNPFSGNGMFKNNLDHMIEKCQARGFQVTAIRANRGRQIKKAFESIDQEEYNRIIVCGGDGTINTCVNSMLKNNIHLPLGIVPVGTANDYAYYFEIPSDLEKAMDIAVGDKTTKADVGTVNEKFFINVAAMGAMVDVSQKTDPYVKTALGPLAYYLRAATELNQVHPINHRMQRRISGRIQKAFAEVDDKRRQAGRNRFPQDAAAGVRTSAHGGNRRKAS